MRCLQILCTQVIQFPTFLSPIQLQGRLNQPLPRSPAELRGWNSVKVFIEEPKTTTAMAVAMGSLPMLFFLLRRNGSIVALCVCVCMC